MSQICSLPIRLCSNSCKGIKITQLLYLTFSILLLKSSLSYEFHMSIINSPDWQYIVLRVDKSWQCNSITDSWWMDSYQISCYMHLKQRDYKENIRRKCFKTVSTALLKCDNNCGSLRNWDTLGIQQQQNGRFKQRLVKEFNKSTGRIRLKATMHSKKIFPFTSSGKANRGLSGPSG